MKITVVRLGPKNESESKSECLESPTYLAQGSKGRFCNAPDCCYEAGKYEFKQNTFQTFVLQMEANINEQIMCILKRILKGFCFVRRYETASDQKVIADSVHPKSNYKLSKAHSRHNFSFVKWKPTNPHHHINIQMHLFIKIFDN